MDWILSDIRAVIPASLAESWSCQLTGLVNKQEFVNLWAVELCKGMESELDWAHYEDGLVTGSEIIYCGKFKFQWRFVCSHKIEFRSQVNLEKGAAMSSLSDTRGSQHITYVRESWSFSIR